MASMRVSDTSPQSDCLSDDLLRSWFDQSLSRLIVFSGPMKTDGPAERTRHVQYLVLKSLVLVQRLMGRRVSLHVADIAVRLGHAARGNQRHVGEPVDE